VCQKRNFVTIEGIIVDENENIEYFVIKYIKNRPWAINNAAEELGPSARPA
jgi:hypothetical protein